MKELYSKLDMIMKTARRGFITISEANHEMEKEIDMYFIEYYNFENMQKAYHKMYKLLFDLTKHKTERGF